MYSGPIEASTTIWSWPNCIWAFRYIYHRKLLIGHNPKTINKMSSNIYLNLDLRPLSSRVFLDNH